MFNSDTIQIARDYYEVGKAPLIVYMKESGEYLLFAETVVRPVSEAPPPLVEP